MTTGARESADMRTGAEFDGGDLDCGGGLLLLLMRNLRRVHDGEILAVHTREPSVPGDLREWARLAGHSIVDTTDHGDHWTVRVRRNPTADAVDPFSGGEATPVGHRLWLYTNFHCNLACAYCCAQSSPRADKRLLPVALAEQVTSQFVAQGGREIMLTGGEPFLHPDLAALVGVTTQQLPVVMLTNAMVFQRGPKRTALESMDRDRLVLQISLDSAEPGPHDANRGAGSHARALDGIEVARSLGFQVRVAATLDERATASVDQLHARLDDIGIPTEDRLIRPVAHQGFAESGVPVTIDDVAPEPTVAVDGIWWHPVAVTDPKLKVADEPLPLAGALATIRETVAVQDAARSEGRRHVFRCA